MTALEDNLEDVFRKAMVGHGMSAADVVSASGVRHLDAPGSMSTSDLCAIARVLGLNEDAVSAHPNYRPRPLELSGVRRLCLPFGSGDVNAWWFSLDGEDLLFDAGFQEEDLIAALPRIPRCGFITHAHRDHIGGMAYLSRVGVILKGRGLEGASEIDPGALLACGPFGIRACDLSGHMTPQTGYHVDGLAVPVLVVGDALFAGSIGRCADPESYRHALARLHAVLDPLPDETVLLPGHGPSTTLGEERRSNPFL